ncbi:MAG: hypothetical protein WA947_10200 [Phormidesmis sp.]
MTSQLQEVLHLTKSLSLAEQIELLKELSTIIQSTHSMAKASSSHEQDDLGFSEERFRSSWQQAMVGETLPLSQLWDDIDDD